MSWAWPSSAPACLTFFSLTQLWYKCDPYHTKLFIYPRKYIFLFFAFSLHASTAGNKLAKQLWKFEAIYAHIYKEWRPLMKFLLWPEKYCNKNSTIEYFGKKHSPSLTKQFLGQLCYVVAVDVHTTAFLCSLAGKGSNLQYSA